ncbi:MAG: hypothetical protein ACHQNE_02185 [Candidatus Kapaibacterium sp.]
MLAWLPVRSARAQEDSTQTSGATPKSSPVQHSIQPSLGVTIESSSEANQETFSAIALAGLDANYFADGEPWQLGMKLYARYGQQYSAAAPPVKSQDDLIMSITPSRTVLPGPKIRLFLETTGETHMAKGLADDSTPTKFLDPLFLYQSLFLGRRFSNQADDGSWQYDLTAGVGYALQETLAQNFILSGNRHFVVTDHNPLSSVQNEVTLESGYSAIVDFDWQEQIGENLQMNAGWKTVAINRVETPTLPAAKTFFENARVTSLLEFGLQYKLLSINYSGNLTYDRNVSLRRSLDQSLVFGFKLTL